MIDFDNFQYNKATIPTDANEKQEFFKHLEQQFYEEIKNSEAAKKYFSNYQPNSVDNFIKSYATKKVHLSQYYQFYVDKYHEKEISELSFQKQAEDVLKIILQKKMFDMQLRWRAGQLEIDGVDIAYDFEFWEKYIFSCPFVPTITKHEAELMKEYLLRFDEDDEVDDRYRSWQDYDSLTEKNEKGLMDELPRWYDFYDSRMGTGMLLLLPDNKGAMEKFYLQCARNSSQTTNSTTDSPTPVPYLSGFGEDIDSFAKYFEKDKYFSALFKYNKYHEEKDNRRPNYDDLEEAIRFLLTADRPVYPNSHLTWDKAIMAAAKEYLNTKIAEALDFVFEEYLMMKELGFSKDKSPEEVKEEYNNDAIVQIYRKGILKGRVQNGDPEDFNY